MLRVFDCSYLSVCFTYFEPLPNKGQERGKRAKPAISAHIQSQGLNIARAAQRHCQRCPAFRLSNGPRLCLYVLALHSSKAKKKKKKKSASLLRGAALPHCARQRRGRTQTQDMPLPRRPVRFRTAFVSRDIFCTQKCPPFLQITQRKFHFSLSPLKYFFF